MKQLKTLTKLNEKLDQNFDDRKDIEIIINNQSFKLEFNADIYEGLSYFINDQIKQEKELKKI